MPKKKESKNNKHPTLKRKLTLGQKAADGLTYWAGSWTFIITLLVGLGVWMVLNIVAGIKHWDPYPFILLNLALSCLAALQAPIILMSQNRAAERDRLNAKYDYQVNRRAEREIQMLMKELRLIKKRLGKKR